MSEEGGRDFVRNPGIALRYAIGCVAFGVAALFCGIWAIVPAWISLTLAVMASAYARFGAGVYRKQNGRIPRWIRLLLWPHTVGVWAVRCWQFRRMKQPFDAIAPGVILGRLLREHEAQALIAGHRVTAVLDVCGEHSEAPAFRKLNYRNIAVLDMNVPSAHQLQEAAPFIEKNCRDGCVYVHCGIGKSRSAAVVAAWLLLTGTAATADEACEIVLQRRPAAKFTPALRAAVQSVRTANPPRP